MRTTILFTLAVGTAFLIGLAAGVGGVVYLGDYVRRQVGPQVHVMGVLREEVNADASASALPPTGFFVESSAIGRVYLEHPEAAGFLGRTISASGLVNVRCGPDGINCFPVIVPEEVREIP